MSPVDALLRVAMTLWHGVAEGAGFAFGLLLLIALVSAGEKK